MAETQNEFFDQNKRAVERELDLGLQKMKEHYTLVEYPTNEFEKLHIQSMDYTVRQFEVVGVGNLLVMDSKDSNALQMASFVLTPFYKNLPLFSTDYMYIQGRRSFLIEFYDLVDKQDEFYLAYMKKFQALKDAHAALPDMPLRECWYDSMKPVCTAKNTTPENDDEILTMFMDNLTTFIDMEQNAAPLSEEEMKKKWELTQAYTDGLVDNGGVSTDVFKAVIGPESTKKFFNSVFFGTTPFKR